MCVHICVLYNRVTKNVHIMSGPGGFETCLVLEDRGMILNTNNDV